MMTQKQDYIESPGTVAKTDKTDAKRIAMFALERRPEPLETMSAEGVAFKELVAFYRQQVRDRSRLKNQLKQVTERFVIKKIMSEIRFFNKQINAARTSEAHRKQRRMENETGNPQIGTWYR